MYETSDALGGWVLFLWNQMLGHEPGSKRKLPGCLSSSPRTVQAGATGAPIGKLTSANFDLWVQNPEMHQQHMAQSLEQQQEQLQQDGRVSRIC